MSVFIDTSAFLALLDADEHHHPGVRSAWERTLNAEDPLFSTNYVLVETLALLQNRIGMNVVRLLHEDVLPVINVLWVDQAIHQAAAGALLAASRKSLSLVDCSSFEVMRRHGIKRAFTLDRHFREQGFSCEP